MRANDIYQDTPRRGRGPRGGQGPFPHRQGHHGHHNHEDRSGSERGRGPWAGDDQLGQPIRNLFGAVRATAHADAATREAAGTLLDETTRSLYRLLADAPATPTPDNQTPDDPAPAA